MVEKINNRTSGKILIRNTQILSMTGAALQQGDILIEQNKIATLGAVSAEEAIGAEVIDGSHTLAMPGLINTHSHAAMTLLRSYADDMELMSWLNDKIWPAEAKFVNESIYWGTGLAVAEMIQNGITTFADMYDSMHEVALCSRRIRRAGQSEPRIDCLFRSRRKKYSKKTQGCTRIFTIRPMDG